jgi:preprotein translocase subunit SecF
MRLFKNPKIDFLKGRKIASSISLLLILAGLLSLSFKGGPKLSIDFTGGHQFLLQYVEGDTNVEKAVISDVRANLESNGYSGCEVTTVSDSKSDIELVRIRLQKLDSTDKPIDELLKVILPKYDVIEKDLVGSRISKELQTDAIWAILLALILILIYIAFRFDFYYAIGSVAALLHDIIITLGIFSLLDMEISLKIIAAFLTIVGYSLNDTIVVFDRIRENIKAFSKNSLEVIVNQSLNETLSRTVITSITTLVVVIMIFSFGGVVIRDFGFALLVGVLIGTYSSIYVASPVMIYFENRAGQKLTKK